MLDNLKKKDILIDLCDFKNVEKVKDIEKKVKFASINRHKANEIIAKLKEICHISDNKEDFVCNLKCIKEYRKKLHVMSDIMAIRLSGCQSCESCNNRESFCKNFNLGIDESEIQKEFEEITIENILNYLKRCLPDYRIDKKTAKVVLDLALAGKITFNYTNIEQNRIVYYPSNGFTDEDAEKMKKWLYDL